MDMEKAETLEKQSGARGKEQASSKS